MRTLAVDCFVRGCDGGHVYYGYPNDPDPPSCFCRECNGTGEIEVELLPITADDLDAMSGTGDWAP